MGILFKPIFHLSKAPDDSRLEADHFGRFNGLESIVSSVCTDLIRLGLSS